MQDYDEIRKRFLAGESQRQGHVDCQVKLTCFFVESCPALVAEEFMVPVPVYLWN